MSLDSAKGLEQVGIQVASGLRDYISHHTVWTITKWDEDATKWAAKKLDVPEFATIYPEQFEAVKVKPYEVAEVVGNLVTDQGWVMMMDGITGTAVTAFSATVGRIGAGTATTTEAYTDTQLGAQASGSAGVYWQLVSAAPTVGTTHSAGIQWSATFGSAVANFAWNEFAVDNGNASGTAATTAAAGNVFFNHKANIAQGTKASGQTWTATATITWS